MPVAPAGLERERARSPLALLAVRDFRVWWLGFVVSANAFLAQAFGVGWLVVELAERQGGAGTAAVYLGMVGLSRAVPSFALGAFGGVVGDRYDRRAVLVAAQAAMGVTVLAMGLLIVTDTMGIAALLVLSALNAIASAFYHPVRQVLAPRIVGEANLIGALGLNSSVLSVAGLTAPLIGGVLVVTIGVGGLLLACGVALIAVAASLATIKAQPSDRTGPGAGSILRSFAEGLGYARRTPAIRWLLIVFGLLTLASRPVPFLLPVLARDVLDVGPTELSLLVSATGVGAILAGLVITWLRSSARTTRLAVLAAVAAGLSIVFLAMQHSLLPAILLVAAMQFFVITCAGLIVATVQLTTPDQIRGRIMGFQNLLADGGTEGGTFLIGAIGGVLGIAMALAVSGGALALLCLPIVFGLRALMRAEAT